MRKITNTGSKKNTGYFPSEKGERPVAFESLLESDFMHLLEFDEDVESFQEQPVTILYRYQNRTYKYTPDLLVRRKRKIQLVEVKPRKKLQQLLDTDEGQRKINAAAQYCKVNGYTEFKIITDEEIRSGNLLNNIKYLFHFSKLEVPASIRSKIRNELMLKGQLQISDLLSILCEDDREKRKYHSYILALIYRHELRTDLQNPISKTSFIEFSL